MHINSSCTYALKINYFHRLLAQARFCLLKRNLFQFSDSSHCCYLFICKSFISNITDPLLVTSWSYSNLCSGNSVILISIYRHRLQKSLEVLKLSSGNTNGNDETPCNCFQIFGISCGLRICLIPLYPFNKHCIKQAKMCLTLPVYDEKKESRMTSCPSSEDLSKGWHAFLHQTLVWN